jgi:hypothetical protein
LEEAGRKPGARAGTVTRRYIVDVVGDLPIILLELEPAGVRYDFTSDYLDDNGQILAGDSKTIKVIYAEKRS